MGGVVCHGFKNLSLFITIMYQLISPIFFRIILLVLGQATLKNIGKSAHMTVPVQEKQP